MTQINGLLILGSAPCCPEDIGAAEIMLDGHEFSTMSVGQKPIRFGFVKNPDYIVSYHPKPVLEVVHEFGLSSMKVTNRKRDGFDIVVPFIGASGSSSLLGVVAAMELEYDKIILCGCPLSDQGYNKLYNIGWKHRYNQIRHHVRSMSGWTRELLGEPTKEWIENDRTLQQRKGN